MAEENSEEVDNGANPGTLIVFGLIFLPAGLTALIFYLLLRKGRLRLSSVFQIFVIFELFIAALWLAFSAHTRFLDFFMNLGEISQRWPDVLPAFILFYFALGAVLGLGIVWWEIREMKNNPHRLELKGNWQYQFKFRRGITQVLKRKRHIEGLKNGVFVDDDKAPLGLNEEEDDRIVSRYYAEASLHTLISGASGSGKSITMQSLIKTDIENHIPTIVIDFKRSPEFASKLAAWAKESGNDFYHFVNGDLKDYDIKNSLGPSYYDPLSGGTPTSKADMVLGMREYDTASAVYRSNMQQLLQVLFSMLHYANKAKAPSIKWGNGGLYQLASAVSGDNFTELTIACEGTPIEVQAQEVALQLKGKTGLRHAMEELQGQVRTIIASEYGRWMKTTSSVEGVADTEANRSIDIFDLTSRPGSIILFSLNSDSEPEFAKYVGSMILADITNTSAKRRNGQLKNQVNVYVDEFQAVNPTAVTGLLEKSRESKMAVTLAQQSFEQVVASAPQNGEAYLLSILDTCSNFIVHNGMTEDSAERLSKVLGKHWVTKYRMTNKNQSFFLSMNWRNKRDSVVNTSEEEVWVFAPRKFMTLMSPSEANGYKSTAVLINKSCSDPAYAGREGAVARRLWMLPENGVLDTYYDPKYKLNSSDVSSHISIVHDDGTDVALMRDADLDFSLKSKKTGDWEPIEPQAYDYFAEKKKQEELRSRSNDAISEDVEDESDEFVFEEIEDDSLVSYQQELEAKPSALPENPLDQWSSDSLPPRRSEQPKPAREPVRTGGLPIPNSRPVAQRDSDRSKEALSPAQDGGEPEEFTLPGL